VIDLTIIAPDPAPARRAPDDAVLWALETRRLPDRDEPKDEDVQEIVVSAGTDDELRLIFDAHEPDLGERVAAVCNSFYVNGGAAGVAALQRAIVESGLRSAGGMPVPSAKRPTVRGEQVYITGALSPKRHALRVALERWQERLPPFAARVIAKVQAVALDLARVKLEASADQTLRQAGRYLRSAQARGTSSGHLVAPGSPLIDGPDLASLAEALTAIATMRRELEHFRQVARDPTARVHSAAILDGMTMLGPALVNPIKAKELRGLLDVPGAITALARATQGYQSVTRMLAIECSMWCRIHPVLHRLWNQPIAYEVADLWNNTPAARRTGALQADGRLARALAAAFDETSAAANAFLADLRAHPETIWRYEPAIEAALRELLLGAGDVAWRATEDHLASVKSEMSPLSQLGLALGGIEVLAASMAVAPPVGAVLAILSGAVSIAEWAEGAVDESRKDRAFQATLDPADSLALEPSSYVGLVVGAVFVLLQLHGAGMAARIGGTP
jgi:hypothetical protein